MSAMPWKRRSLRRSRHVRAPFVVPVAVNVFVPTVATPVLAAARTVALASVNASATTVRGNAGKYNLIQNFNERIYTHRKFNIIKSKSGSLSIKRLPLNYFVAVYPILPLKIRLLVIYDVNRLFHG